MSVYVERLKVLGRAAIVGFGFIVLAVVFTCIFGAKMQHYFPNLG